MTTQELGIVCRTEHAQYCSPFCREAYHYTDSQGYGPVDADEMTRHLVFSRGVLKGVAERAVLEARQAVRRSARRAA